MPRVKALTRHDRELNRLCGEIRMALADANMNQSQVASKLGLTQPTVSNILKKPKNMKLDYFLEIMEMTGRKIVIQKRGDQGDD